jgi:hypothetical protein
VLAGLAAPDLRGDFPMTGRSLRKYEEWPDGGRRPSVRTLELLGHTYGTDPHNLLDHHDYALLPPSDLLLLNAEAPGEDKAKSSIADSIVGQAAAAIGIIAAVIYAAGGLTLGLQWAYIAQFTFNGKGAVIKRTITAVPVPAIELKRIGRGSGCGDLGEIYRAIPRPSGGQTR